MERFFADDVKQLGHGAGRVLQGEGILAIAQTVLQSGVSYVGGYPGAPVSHLLIRPYRLVRPLAALAAHGGPAGAGHRGAAQRERLTSA